MTLLNVLKLAFLIKHLIFTDFSYKNSQLTIQFNFITLYFRS